MAALEPLQSLGFGLSSLALAGTQHEEARRKVRLRNAGTHTSAATPSPPQRPVPEEPGPGQKLVLRGGSAVSTPEVRIQRGRPTWIVGESGSGKTSLLECVLGLGDSRATAYTNVTLDGAEAALPESAYLPQSPHLLHANASTNVAFGRESSSAVTGLLEALGLPEFAAHGARGTHDVAGEQGGVSGGEARRIALARALLPGPTLLCLDEPTAGVDAAHRADIWAAIEREAAHRFVVVVTHDAGAPIRASDTVVRLPAGSESDRDTSPPPEVGETG